MPEAIITTPDATRTPVKYRIRNWGAELRDKAVIVYLDAVNAEDRDIDVVPVRVSSRDANGNETWAAFIAFHQALTTARSGETGTVERRINYRALGYLVDAGFLTGVSLVS